MTVIVNAWISVSIILLTNKRLRNVKGNNLKGGQSSRQFFAADFCK